MIQIDLDKIVPMQEVPNRLDKLVDDAHAGSIFVITKDDRPAVAIVSIDQLEGLSGRKVVTPMADAAPADTPPPPPPPPAVPPIGPEPAAPALPPPPPPPASDLSTPTTSVQRDLTPGLPPPPPTPPVPGTTPPPSPAAPDKIDEMPL